MSKIYIKFNIDRFYRVVSVYIMGCVKLTGHMMASLRLPCQSLVLTKPAPVIITRLKSDENRKKNGREAWQARRVPSGFTQYANFLVKIGHREIWRKRTQHVNKEWKQTLIDVGQNKAALEEKIHKDPPKLLMVRRVKTIAGRPYWEKDYIKQLGLHEEKEIKVFKNTQTNSGLLRKVKHLVEILPITFPYGLPESQEDLEHCILCDNGEFIFKKRIESSSLRGIETTTEIVEDKWQISQELLDRTLELKKQKFQIHQEFYPTVYSWKRNEDGKERRYKGNNNIGSDMIWY